MCALDSKLAVGDFAFLFGLFHPSGNSFVLYLLQCLWRWHLEQTFDELSLATSCRSKEEQVSARPLNLTRNTLLSLADISVF